MRIFQYVSLFAIFALSACEKEVNVKIPEHQPKLVLNSVLAPNEIIKAAISRTRQSIGVLDTSSYNVNNATVLLFENGNFLDTLKFKQKYDTVWIDPINNYYDLKYQYGYFPTKTYPIEIGKNYKITAALTNYATISAETTIPSVPTISEINFTPNIFKRGNVNLSNLAFKIANSNAQNQKYYVRLLADFTQDGFTDTMKMQQMFISKESNDVLSGSVEPSLTDTYTISSDELTNNTVNILVSEGYSNSAAPHFHKIYVSVYNVTADYDKYVQKYLLQGYSGDFSLTPPTPVIMYSNVLNGYGILGGYSLGTAIKQL